MCPRQDDELEKQYLSILSQPGVQAVMDWRVPNDDDAVDDIKKAEEFSEDADAYVTLVSNALNFISAKK